MLKTWEKILIVLVMLIVAFLGGYFTAPKKIETKTEAKTEKVEVEKEVVKYVVREISKPDGTVIREQEVVKDIETKKQESNEQKRIAIQEKQNWQWKIDYLGLYNTHQNGLSHGLKISKKIGKTPFDIGVWGVNGVGVGISVGMEF